MCGPQNRSDINSDEKLRNIKLTYQWQWMSFTDNWVNYYEYCL